MNNVILKAKNIKKSYDQNQVLDLDKIKIYESSLNFLIGPNGSGKTTLLNILSLVDTDYCGKVIYRDREINKEEFDILNLRRNFSVIWQNPYLFKGNVTSNIGLPLKLRKENNQKINKKVNQIAKELDITNLLDKRSNELSGGERQKVSIARALITEPEILFIDEPNNSLDYESSRYFNNLFSNLTEEGITILLITHDLYQIKNFADYITILNKGEVLESGPSHKIDI